MVAILFGFRMVKVQFLNGKKIKNGRISLGSFINKEKNIHKTT